MALETKTVIASGSLTNAIDAANAAADLANTKAGLANDAADNANDTAATVDSIYTSSFNVVPQLFNPNAVDVQLGRILSSGSGTNTDADYNTTGFIAVEESTAYTFQGCRWIRFFDSSKVELGSIYSNGGSVDVTRTSDAGAAYVRASILIANWSDSVQIELGSTATEIFPFGKATLKPEALVFEDESIDRDKVDFFETVPQLINRSGVGVELGKALSSTTGNTNTSASYNTTGYISVSSDTDYTFTKCRWLWFYDSSFVKIGTNVISITSSPTTQTSPANAAYMRISVSVTNWTISQAEEGDTATTVYDFGRRILKEDTLPIPDAVPVEINNQFYGANYITYGDSLTATDSYWYIYVTASLAAIRINEGVSGERSDQITARLIADIIADPTLLDEQDLFVYFAGTNDFRQSTPLGVLGTSDDTTFYICK
jgi:hypothetical protein